MSRMNILIVGIEKELPDFEEAVEASKKVVGPIKVFSAHRAIDAVSKLGTCMSSCGSCQGVLLSHHFSAKGKEEYAELIRKLLRDKHPTVPIVCWGLVKKGGEQGKDYHFGLDWKPADGAAPVAKVLLMLKNGEIVPEYHGKGRKSIDEPRKSLDNQGSQSPLRPKSLDAKAAPATSSRKSVEVQDGKNSPVGKAKKTALDAVASPRASLDFGAVKGAMSPRGSMDVTRGQPGSGGGSYSAMTPMTGLSPMTSMSSMTGMGMMPVSMAGMSGSSGCMAPAMNNMGLMGMGGMTPRGGSGMGMMGMSSMGLAPEMMPMMPMNGMAGQGMGFSSPSGSGPAPPPQPAAAVGDGGGASSNTQLIRALAEEVMRLKVLVEEKRARETAAAAAQGPAAMRHPLSAVSHPLAAAPGAGGLSMGVVRLESPAM